MIGLFEGSIEKLVALAALMPIVASTGGIAGTQSLAVSVRALATRDLTAQNARRVVLRELGAGALTGLALAFPGNNLALAHYVCASDLIEAHGLAADLAIDDDGVALDVEFERLVAAEFEHFLDGEGGELGVIEEVVFEFGPFADELLVGFAEGADRLGAGFAVLERERDGG